MHGIPLVISLLCVNLNNKYGKMNCIIFVDDY